MALTNPDWSPRLVRLAIRHPHAEAERLIR